MGNNDATVAVESDRAATSPTISRTKAWYTVGLLTFLFILSYVDRSILALLAEPVSLSLGLADRQLAILLGFGFAFVYAVCGVPLAQLIDTRNRRIVVTAGVTIWSVSTVASSLATGFWSLLALRSGVALGEAVLTPAAVSLVADMFTREKRNLPMSVYLSVGGFMTIGSYVVGAMAYDISKGFSDSMGMEPWQMTFVLVGAPGLLLAAIFAMTAANPPRTASMEIGQDDTSWRTFFSYIRERIWFFGPLISSAGIYAFFGMALIIWLPTVLVRQEGLPLSEAGYILGWIGIAPAIAGNFFWPWVASRIDRIRPKHGVATIFLIASIFTSITFAFAVYTGGTTLYVVLAIGIFFASTYAVMPAIGFLQFGPQRMRARMAAFNLLMIGILGLGLGPLVAVELGALIGEGDTQLSTGLIALTLMTAPILILLSVTLLKQVGRAEIQD